MRITIVGNHYNTNTPPSVLLYFQQNALAKYLFNVPEGTQRLFSQSRIKLGGDRLQQIFLTRSSASTFGGLGGLFLTLTDAGAQNLSVTCPNARGVDRLFQQGNRFLHRPLVTLQFKSASPRPQFQLSHGSKRKQQNLLQVVYQDEHVTIEAFSLFPAGTAREEDKVVCFIGTGRSLRGKFNAKRAKELGIPAGPLFSELARGNSVVLADGAEITSDQVLDAPMKGGRFAILECPDLGYLEQLVERFDVFVGKELDVVVHLCPANVLRDERYQKWVCSAFGKDTEHLFTNELMCPAEDTLDRSREVHKKLQLIDSQVFPPLAEVPAFTADQDLSELFSENNVKAFPGEHLLSFDMTPKLRGTSRFGRDFSMQKVERVSRNDSLESAEFLQQSAEYARNKLEIGTDQEMLYPEVHFHGTGSCIPSTYRNVSGIQLILNEQHDSMFLDAGEGTFGQMIRKFGRAKAIDLVCRTKVFWISHHHADHHLGLLALLSTFHQYNQTDSIPIVVAPKNVLAFLQTFSSISSDRFHFTPLDCRLLKSDTSPIESDGANEDDGSIDGSIDGSADGALKQLSDIQLQLTSVRVVHCPDAFAVVVRKDGWKLLYSGDTRPCEAIVKAGKDADILIHEATFNDDLEEEALAKKHSTVSQAVEIGTATNAKFTILTHFSQRYKAVSSSLPCVYDPNSAPIALAFDMSTFSRSQIPWIAKLSPLFEFAIDTQEEEEKDVEL